VYNRSDIIAFSSEKNYYIRADIAQIWSEYRKYVGKIKFDNKGRAILHLDWVVGKSRIRPMTTLEKTIILKRDENDKNIISKIEPEDALDYLEDNDYCNPHTLVNNRYKREIRRDFFKVLLNNTEIYMLNTIKSPEETNDILFKVISGKMKF
ncbi:MAG: aldolase, partial [Candidatus Odinarchaeia archaeon]